MIFIQMVENTRKDADGGKFAAIRELHISMLIQLPVQTQQTISFQENVEAGKIGTKKTNVEAIASWEWEKS